MEPGFITRSSLSTIASGGPLTETHFYAASQALGRTWEGTLDEYRVRFLGYPPLESVEDLPPNPLYMELFI